MTPSAPYSSPDPVPDAIPPRRTARDLRLRPLGLGFVDRGLEASWWSRYAQDRQRVLRGNIALLYILSAGFGLVDNLVFTAQATTLLTARAVMMVLLLIPAPWIFGRGSLTFLERHAQHALLYLSVAATISLSAASSAVPTSPSTAGATRPTSPPASTPREGPALWLAPPMRRGD